MSGRRRKGGWFRGSSRGAAASGVPYVPDWAIPKVPPAVVPPVPPAPVGPYPPVASSEVASPVLPSVPLAPEPPHPDVPRLAPPAVSPAVPPLVPPPVPPLASPGTPTLPSPRPGSLFQPVALPGEADPPYQPPSAEAPVTHRLPAPTPAPEPTFTPVHVQEVVPKGAARRDERNQRVKERRNRKIALVAVVVVVAAATLALVLPGGHHKKKLVAAVRTQRTLLFAVGNPGQPATEAVLFAVDPVAGTGSMLLLPGPTIAQAPGYGATTIGGSFGYPTVQVAAATVSDLLNVIVDGVWRLKPSGLDALVNAVHGVQVAVDVQVPGPRGEILLQPGTQLLNGVDAVAFATYLAPGEPEQDRLTRLQKVLDAVFAALPKQNLVALIDRLSAGSTATETMPQIASFLQQLAASSYLTTTSILPVEPIDTGAVVPALEADTSQVAALVSQTLAASIPTGRETGGDRVFILNNTGDPLLALSARDLLDDANLDYVGSNNQLPLHQYRGSVVVIFSETPAAIQLGQRVAAALHLPTSAVQFSDRSSTIADVEVILGANFRG